MTQSPAATHTILTIERTYAASPERVFAAWASAEAKALWFVGPEGWAQNERILDFRVGGRERLLGAFPDGRLTDFAGRYHDIRPGQRIVFSYDMRLNARLISVSLATVEIAPEAAGAKLTYTEHATFLDGHEDSGGRERGVAAHLDRLQAHLARETAAA